MAVPEFLSRPAVRFAKSSTNQIGQLDQPYLQYRSPYQSSPYPAPIIEPHYPRVASCTAVMTWSC